MPSGPYMRIFLAPKKQQAEAGHVRFHVVYFPSDELICMPSVPCDTNVAVSIIFGGTAFTISPETLNLGPYGSGSNKCVGSISADDGFGEYPT